VEFESIDVEETTKYVAHYTNIKLTDMHKKESNIANSRAFCYS